VQDRVLALDHELTLLELETASRYLNENFRGWPIDRIRRRWSAAWRSSARSIGSC